MNRRRRMGLILLAALAAMAGAFSIGSGLGKTVNNIRIGKSFEDSEVGWRQDLAAGADGEDVRDRRNRELAENMQYVSLNRVLHFADGTSAAEADIAVDARSRFGCVVSIIRDATGEELYRSGVIDPGHYIERIQLNSYLRNGYYPCTAVWSYYTDGDEYVGETAWKMVVIIGG